ncbi:hypothetical protein AB0K48_12180 [Nonomuraea sp. NPDC055795]
MPFGGLQVAQFAGGQAHGAQSHHGRLDGAGVLGRDQHEAARGERLLGVDHGSGHGGLGRRQDVGRRVWARRSEVWSDGGVCLLSGHALAR